MGNSKLSEIGKGMLMVWRLAWRWVGVLWMEHWSFSRCDLPEKIDMGSAGTRYVGYWMRKLEMMMSMVPAPDTGRRVVSSPRAMYLLESAGNGS